MPRSIRFTSALKSDDQNRILPRSPSTVAVFEHLEHGIAAQRKPLKAIADVRIDEKAGRAAAFAVGLHVSGRLASAPSCVE